MSVSKMQPYWKQPIILHKVGRSHIFSGMPCQDAFFIGYSKNQKWTAVVVCDGAGSASRSLEGATITSEGFGKALLQIAEKLETRSPGHWINDQIIQCIIDIRKSLRTISSSDSISDFHTTVVAALIGPTGGVTIHIGDGAIFGGKITTSENETLIDKEFFISKPENGEYANETFFLTESDWIKHLRITPLPNLDWLALGSDGGCAIALENDVKLRHDFFNPLFSEVFENKTVIEDINNFLYQEDGHSERTNDDITLILIISNKEHKIEKITSQSTDVVNDPIELADAEIPKPKKWNGFTQLNKTIVMMSFAIFVLSVLVGLLAIKKGAKYQQCTEVISIKDVINQADNAIEIKKPSDVENLKGIINKK